MTNFKEIIEKHTLESEPVGIEALIKELGIELDKKADLGIGQDGKEILGKIEKIDVNKYKISINKNDHYFRQRFTMAHELGHFILHKDLIGDGIEDTALYRSPSNTAVTETHEIEANKFAASLLMPLRHIKNDYIEMDKDINKIAAKWQVSPAALKIRLGL